MLKITRGGRLPPQGPISSGIILRDEPRPMTPSRPSRTGQGREEGAAMDLHQRLATAEKTSQGDVARPRGGKPHHLRMPSQRKRSIRGRRSDHRVTLSSTARNTRGPTRPRGRGHTTHLSEKSHPEGPHLRGKSHGHSKLLRRGGARMLLRPGPCRQIRGAITFPFLAGKSLRGRLLLGSVGRNPTDAAPTAQPRPGTPQKVSVATPGASAPAKMGQQSHYALTVRNNIRRAFRELQSHNHRLQLGPKDGLPAARKGRGHIAHMARAPPDAIAAAPSSDIIRKQPRAISIGPASHTLRHRAIHHRPRHGGRDLFGPDQAMEHHRRRQRRRGRRKLTPLPERMPAGTPIKRVGEGLRLLSARRADGRGAPSPRGPRRIPEAPAQGHSQGSPGRTPRPHIANQGGPLPGGQP